MEQVIKSELIEQETRSLIEEEYEIISVRDENAITFVTKNESCAGNEAISKLCLMPYAVAMRRNPPIASAKRLPCMADVIRVEINYINGIITNSAYRRRGYMKKVLTGALEYQNRMRVPFTLLDCENEGLFERYGFHYIYDKPEYELNNEVITLSMLERADNGEAVRLEPSNITLTALDKSRLLTLAHFVNANLCKKYGLFVIRNALYYEKLQRTLLERSGNIYLINEDGRIKGSFIYIKGDTQPIRETIFENELDIMSYFYVSNDKKPTVMARIVNLSEMLKHISSRGKVSIAIRLSDPVIAENNGLFIWYIDENGGRMERVEEDSDAPQMRPEISTTIGELSAFFFEYIRLKENIKFDSIYLSGPAWINEIF